jgi:hypothetical protein
MHNITPEGYVISLMLSSCYRLLTCKKYKIVSRIQFLAYIHYEMSFYLRVVSLTIQNQLHIYTEFRMKLCIQQNQLTIKLK